MIESLTGIQKEDPIRTKSKAERRSFLKINALTIAMVGSGEWLEGGAFSGIKHRYKLASESLLLADIQRAPEEVREAYRFALANRIRCAISLVLRQRRAG